MWHSEKSLIEVMCFRSDGEVANTYLVKSKKNYIVIDPSNDPTFLNYIKDHPTQKLNIFLTHEHFDHVLGLEYLRVKYNCTVIATVKCSSYLQSSEGNYSKYSDKIDAFTCRSADIELINEYSIIKVPNMPTIQCIGTPGHSPGSVCFKILNAIFTGDTVLPGKRQVINLPCSNRHDYKDSIKLLNKYSKNGDNVYSGHGNSFQLTEKLFNYLLNNE